MIYDALRNASCWVANDYFKNSRGFSFTLCDDRQIWNMGEDVPWQENLQCKVSTPYRARVKLYKNGELAAESEGREHLFQGITRGIYRVEAYLRYRCKYRPWIFTNSIWVN